MVTAAIKLKDASPLKKSYDQPRHHLEKQRHHFADKGPSNESYGFSSGYVWMWELDSKESWAPKNWCFWTVVLEKTLESSLDCREIQPVHPKGNQSWIFIGRTDVEAEAPVLWLSESVKSLSRVRLFATPWTVAHQAPRSMGFSRQEYWSGLPFPSPRDLPNPRIEPRSPALQADALTSEPPILWLADAKNWLIWKDPDAGKDWRWEEKGMTEDEMVGWHHRLNGHEFE